MPAKEQLPKYIRVAGVVYRLEEEPLPKFIRVGGVVYRLAAEPAPAPAPAQQPAQKPASNPVVQKYLGEYETKSDAVRKKLQGDITLMDQALTKAHQALLAADPNMASQSTTILNTIVGAADKLAQEIKAQVQELANYANTIVGAKGMG